MQDNMDAIFKAIQSKKTSNNQTAINDFLKTKDGQNLVNTINSLDKNAVLDLLNKIPQSKIDEALKDPQKFLSLTKDPNMINKIKKNLK